MVSKLTASTLTLNAHDAAKVYVCGDVRTFDFRKWPSAGPVGHAWPGALVTSAVRGGGFFGEGEDEII